MINQLCPRFLRSCSMALLICRPASKGPWPAGRKAPGWSSRCQHAMCWVWHAGRSAWLATEPQQRPRHAWTEVTMFYAWPWHGDLDHWMSFYMFFKCVWWFSGGSVWISDDSDVKFKLLFPLFKWLDRLNQELAIESRQRSEGVGASETQRSSKISECFRFGQSFGLRLQSLCGIP